MKFLSGFIIGALTIISFNHFNSSSEEVVSKKDTISIRLADQVIEIPDTTKHDSVK